MTAVRPMPTRDDVLGYFDTLSNWGRWGDEDERGTLNHITDDVRVAAARAVRHGRSVSCAWEVGVPGDMERSTTTCPCAADMPGGENMPVPAFHADRRWGFSSERLGITFHGNTLTHVDSPCHLFWDGKMYNGRSHSLVDAETGSAWAAVTAAANGIITRGVLLDVARAREVPWLEPGRVCSPKISRRPSVARVYGCDRAMRCSCVPAMAVPGTRAVRPAVSRRPAGTRPACHGCTNAASR